MSSNYIAATAQHREDVVSKFDSGILLIGGGKSAVQYDTDRDLPFRQESNFFYLTGCNEPDMLAMINSADGKYTLFAPNLPESLAMWMGPLPTFEDIRVKYGADEVLDVASLPQVLESFSSEKFYVYPLLFPMQHLSNYEVDETMLQEVIEENRIYKKSHEIEEMKLAASVTNKAFRTTMALTRPGMKEYQVHALFEGTIMNEGCKNPSFMPIAAAGRNASILHYVKNDKVIEQNDLVLLDAGAETSNLYAADVTRVFPASGTFTKEQRDLVDLVNKMNNAAFELCKPGVPFELCHRAAERAAAIGMIELGLASGTVEEILEAHVVNVFFVHGLGHLLGLDVHDKAGYPKNVERIAEPGIRYLRLRRNLEVGMVITVEAGFYFIDAFLKQAYEDPNVSKYLVKEKIDQYYAVGGVRLEDDLLITENGHLNLTSEIPKTVEEIEAFCRGARSVQLPL
ncbi:hypothetical protein RCL1_006250 [Eukaryota sp. TZLM3-RCL]